MIALFFPRVVYYLSTIRYMVPIYEGNTKQYSLEILGAAGAFSDDYTNNLY